MVTSIAKIVIGQVVDEFQDRFRLLREHFYQCSQVTRCIYFLVVITSAVGAPPSVINIALESLEKCSSSGVAFPSFTAD